MLVADGSSRVVDGDGVGADQHRVAQRRAAGGCRGAGLDAGHPAAGAVGGGAAAVEGGGELPGHERAAVVDGERPDRVESRAPRPRAGRRSTSTPAAREGRGATGGDRVGSAWAKTTRATPASTSAWAHGPVRPVWLQGSRVTTAVAPRARSPASASASASACGRAGAAVEALGDLARRRRRAGRSRRAGSVRAGTPGVRGELDRAQHRAVARRR